MSYLGNFSSVPDYESLGGFAFFDRGEYKISSRCKRERVLAVRVFFLILRVLLEGKLYPLGSNQSDNQLGEV